MPRAGGASFPARLCLCLCHISLARAGLAGEVVYRVLPSVHRAPFVQNSREARPRALRALPCCVPTLLVPVISPPPLQIAARFGAGMGGREGDNQGGAPTATKKGFQKAVDKLTSTSRTGGGRGGRGRGRGRGRGGGEDMMDDQMYVAEFPHIHLPTPNLDQAAKTILPPSPHPPTGQPALQQR
jgi:hypothetical protein